MIQPQSNRPVQAAPRVYLETFGCQMNELDSELVRGQLEHLGYRFIDTANDADVILYNTCSVREQAENKVLSRVGLIGKRKRNGEKVVLGVIGCMAEREGAGMIDKYPQIDLMCGPGELDRLPILLDNVMKSEHVERAERIALQGNRTRRSSTLSAVEDNLELLDLSRAFDPDRGGQATDDQPGSRSAYVRITRGCNKFCTYCVVPHTRGGEVHRPPDTIIEECRRLADRGVIEITLLGQTVNHYIYSHGAAVTVGGREMPQVGPGLGELRRLNAERQQDRSPHPAESDRHITSGQGTARFATGRVTTFADLLHRIHEAVPAIQRLRFVTSYPRDFTDAALAVMAESPRICKYLHVPAQSGSNRILKLMNRGYTVEEYLEFIDRARSYMPEISIAGDIIVGFPTETDEDFDLTCQLLHRVRFKNNFIFKYSPRPGTAAITRFVDDVPEPVKRRRNNELLRLQANISAEVHASYVGRTVEVFVEQVSRTTRKRISRQIRRKELVSLTVGSVSTGEYGSGTDRAGLLSDEANPIQLSGRTDGDLIVAFDVPTGGNLGRGPEDMIGRLVRVRIEESAPLLLKGSLVEGQ